MMMQAEVNQGLQEGLDVLKQQKALAEALSQTRGEEVHSLKQQISTLTEQLTEAQDRVQQAEIIRRKLHNTILVRHGTFQHGTFQHGSGCQSFLGAVCKCHVHLTAGSCYACYKYFTDPATGNQHCTQVVISGLLFQLRSLAICHHTCKHMVCWYCTPCELRSDAAWPINLRPCTVQRL